jgi:hypothetical protein
MRRTASDADIEYSSVRVEVTKMARASRRVVPDFSKELARCDELESTYSDDPYWALMCDEWVDDVAEKIRAWNPRLTRRFLVTSVFEESARVYMTDEESMTRTKLIELRQRRHRLELVIMSRQRFGWILNLLGP